MSHRENAEASHANKPSRRRVVSTVAWTAPVIATAGLAPFSAASTHAALTVNWTNQYTESLVQADIEARALSLGITADAQVLTNTWPQSITFTNNTADPYNGSLTATVVIEPSSGINVSLLDTSRLTVVSVGAPAGSTETPTVSAPTLTAGGTAVTIDFGTYSIAPGESLEFSVTFGYTNPGGLGLSLAVFSTYTANITATADAPTVVESGADGIIRHYLAAGATVPGTLTATVNP